MDNLVIGLIFEKKSYHQLFKEAGSKYPIYKTQVFVLASMRNELVIFPYFSKERCAVYYQILRFFSYHHYTADIILAWMSEYTGPFFLIKVAGFLKKSTFALISFEFFHSLPKY